MRAGTVMSSSGRHVVTIALQALLVAAIIGLVALMLSPVYRPATFVVGTQNVDAGGRLVATIAWADRESRVAATTSGDVSFAVGRSIPDNDPVMWVSNKCYAGNGDLVYWVDLPVRWGTDRSLDGEAGPFETKGTHCKAYATLKPWASRVLGDAIMRYDVG